MKYIQFLLMFSIEDIGLLRGGDGSDELLLNLHFMSFRPSKAVLLLLPLSLLHLIMEEVMIAM